jgi:hypothetical protein
MPRFTFRAAGNASDDMYTPAQATGHIHAETKEAARDAICEEGRARGAELYDVVILESDR